jgi:glycosyltransferase involved in cell wall biosynthesis
LEEGGDAVETVEVGSMPNAEAAKEVAPRVSIAIPVYNGERYLAEAIESVLAQTYSDFELLIGDNASTDGTPEIIAKYAAQDPRIRPFRRPQNLGAGGNFTTLFEDSRGEYFKWLAADDKVAPVWLQTCVDALDGNPDAALAYTMLRPIDDEGAVMDRWPEQEAMVWPRGVVGRYRRLMDELTYGRQQGHGVRAWPMVYIWGLMRSSHLRTTALLRSHVNSDSNLLAEIILRGPYVEVPEYLNFVRVHKGAYSWGGLSFTEKQTYFDPGRAKNSLKTALDSRNRYFEFLKDVLRSGLNPYEKVVLLGYNLLRPVKLRFFFPHSS